MAFNRSGDFTLASAIVGNGTVTKNNTNTVLIPVSNIYTGNTTISAGALRISNAGALGDTTAQTSIQNDPTARLELIGTLTLAEPLLVAQKQSVAGGGPLRRRQGDGSDRRYFRRHAANRGDGAAERR